MSEPAFGLANQRMVDRLIAEGALWSPPLIRAFRQTPRHNFLQRVFLFQHRREGWRELDTCEPTEENLDLLYSDRALITKLGQARDGQPTPVSSSSQPSLMAEMLEDLDLQQGQRVLEIGAGSGYNAALMAHVAGPGLVHSMDIDREVLTEAAEHLDAFADRGVHLHHGDGRAGFAAATPYDRIMVTAATPDFEPAWLAQLVDGGVLVAPVNLAPGMSYILRGAVREGVFRGGLTRAAHFMRLRSEDEAPREDSTAPEPVGTLKTLPAPWAGWFDRHRPRMGWTGFIQSLVFYGWLRGYEVLHSGASGYGGQGVKSQEAVCWFYSEDWQVEGDAGRELAQELWRDWLDAGGPWPTEFHLTAATEATFQATAPQSFMHQSVHCSYLWELMANRRRAAWK